MFYEQAIASGRRRRRLEVPAASRSCRRARPSPGSPAPAERGTVPS